MRTLLIAAFFGIVVVGTAAMFLAVSTSHAVYRTKASELGTTHDPKPMAGTCGKPLLRDPQQAAPCLGCRPIPEEIEFHLGGTLQP